MGKLLETKPNLVPDQKDSRDEKGEEVVKIDTQSDSIKSEICQSSSVHCKNQLVETTQIFGLFYL